VLAQSGFTKPEFLVKVHGVPREEFAAISRRGVDIGKWYASTQIRRIMSEPAVEDEIQEDSATGQTASPKTRRHHDGGVLLIGIFKLVKSAFFFCVGLGALHLLHRDLGDVAMRVMLALHFDPEWRIVSIFTEKADLIDMKHLREIGVGVFAYSGLSLVEGIGLVLEKSWAEYLTISLTIAFLPWELWELAHGPTMFRVGILLTNLAVLAYLLWLLNRKKKFRAS
jgi:uncharacterized membrane protein (DUF2068 family)